MSDKLPDYLSQGEPARLFPVLATSSKEGRATSIFLACLSKVDELGHILMADIGQRMGKRSVILAYTEIVMKKKPNKVSDRPDGLIVIANGKKEWRILVESKIGSADLDANQIERYRISAKENNMDCLVTISNDFTTTPFDHPLESTRKSRLKIPVFHWSWMHILTTVELLLTQESVVDQDQRLLLNEFRRFLTHESTGVRGFVRMPKEWSELNKRISSGGIIASKSEETRVVLEAWHQETKDLSLILSRMIEVRVAERLSRKHKLDLSERFSDELKILTQTKQLRLELEIPDAIAPLEIIADLNRKSIDVGMLVRAPEDKKTTKARVNWILRQIKHDNLEDLNLRLFWPGKSEATQHPVKELLLSPEISTEGKEHLVVLRFFLFSSKYLGSRFAQQVNFITDLERIVPEFYKNFGSNLVAWKKKAPKVKLDKLVADDVSTEAISDDAEEYKG